MLTEPHLVGAEALRAILRSGDVCQEELRAGILQRRADASETPRRQQLPKAAGEAAADHTCAAAARMPSLRFASQALSFDIDCNRKVVSTAPPVHKKRSSSMLSSHIKFYTKPDKPSSEPSAVMAGPHTSSGLRPRLSARMPDGMFMHSRASAYALRVVPTAAAPTPKLCGQDRTDIRIPLKEVQSRCQRCCPLQGFAIRMRERSGTAE